MITFVEPLLLGISTGTWCAMYCAPVLLPFLLGRPESNTKKTITLTLFFLFGRLISYSVLGFLLASAGMLTSSFFDPVFARRLSAVAYIFCGIVLIGGSFARKLMARFGWTSCGSSKGCSENKRKTLDHFIARILPLTSDKPIAFFSGICVALHICPPFWAACVRSAEATSPIWGALYFLLFYIGTLPFFLPVLGVPFVATRFAGMKKIARMTQALIGGYFLIFAGLIPFFLKG